MAEGGNLFANYAFGTKALLDFSSIHHVNA